MKKYTYFLFLLPFIASAQSADSDSLLQQGKTLFREADKMPIYNKEKAHQFQTSFELLERFLKQQPENSEAHYFCGYVLDRMNGMEGRDSFDMTVMNTPVTYKGTVASSEHFEWILNHEKKYSGQKFILNPAGKITSVWGALAFRCLVEGKRDSAKLAFAEGKKRGGFTPQYLELGKNMLQSCSLNAVLFTWGDNDSYPLWYLQEIEQFRPDVAVLNLSLIQTKWFIKFAQNQWKVPFGMTDTQIDSLPDYFTPYEAEAKSVKLPKSLFPKQPTFRWNVEPSGDNYLLRSDYAIAAFLKANALRRPVCYGWTVPYNNRKFLNPYLKFRGLTLEVAPAEQPSQDRQPRTDIATLKTFQNLSFDALKLPSTLDDDDYLVCSSVAQYSFVDAIRNAAAQGDLKTAKQLLALFEAQLPNKAFQRDELLEKEVETLREMLKK